MQFMKDDCPSWAATHLRQPCGNPQECCASSVLLLNESWHRATASQPWTNARALEGGMGIKNAISGRYKVMAQCHSEESKAKHSYYHNKMSSAWHYCSQRVSPLLYPWSGFKYDLCCSRRLYNPYSQGYFNNKHNFLQKCSLNRRRKPSLYKHILLLLWIAYLF